MVLGQLQMAGAVVGVYLLLTTGVSELTLAACAATGTLTVLSRLLFGSRPRK